MPDSEQVYIVYPAVIAPSVLTIVALVWGFAVSLWAFAALPLIWLGAICSEPNMNLVRGCLAYLAMIAGFIVLKFFEPLGMVILLGTVTGYYASGLEKRLCMRPFQDDAMSE